MGVKADEHGAERGPRTPDGRLRLPWLDPDEQTWAVALPRRGPDGAQRDPFDRKGRLRADTIDLIAATMPLPDGANEVGVRHSGLDDADERWLLAASSRSWSAITGRFGAQSLATALRLVVRGIVELRVPVTGAVLDLDHPRRWRLTQPWEAAAAQVRDTRMSRRQSAAEAAEAAAEAVTNLDPGLAGALRSSPSHWNLLPVLVAAARDLASGVRHDGPRAFSQTHFGDSKAREDAPDILRDAGASEESIDALGLRRSPYVGFGGPIIVSGLTASSVPGPVRFRADPHRPLPVIVEPRAARLLFVENLQAAEAICDQHPDIATIWFAGQPSDAALEVCAVAAQQAARQELHVLIAPDADLGGARIAARLLGEMPPGLELCIVDAGSVPHPSGPLFSETTCLRLEQLRASAVGLSGGPYSRVLARFITAMASRGHAVEQEATIRAAVEQAIDSYRSRP